MNSTTGCRRLDDYAIRADEKTSIQARYPKTTVAAAGARSVRFQDLHRRGDLLGNDLCVLVPTAAPGIVAATILAFGRAMRETTAVAMLIGNRLTCPGPSRRRQPR